MRLGLFLALVVPLVAIVGMIAPISFGPLPTPPGKADAPTRTQCLALESEPLFGHGLPDPLRLQLLPQPATGYLDAAPVYQADIGPDSLRAIFFFSVWQPAGPDSIDITWHHSPVVRIPARGERRVGRVARRGAVSFFEALLLPDRMLQVHEVPCPLALGA
jgi:hypothetical protein